jgi:abortive infection bacteriophage resistance protein
MKCPKTAKTFHEQADLLLSRGMVADRDLLISRLSEVNYYRLSAYWYPFRNSSNDHLQPGTSFDTVWDRYVFDRQLRVLTMDAVERAEVSIRTRLVNTFCLQHGAVGHVDRNNLPNLKPFDHRKFMDKIHGEERQSKEAFVQHYHSHYTSETELPLWMACELMTFGTMFTLYRGVDASVKQDVAKAYGVSDRVLKSWLNSLNTVRNICAHHARLWNRVMGTPIMIPRPKHHPDWHNPVNIAVADRRTFAILTVLRYLLREIAPQSRWQDRLTHLLEQKHPQIPIAQMGFPANWKDCPIWREDT